ncbi:MAG TPA: hypothetical protein VE010_15230, partial [Thermoanaerobaculia bacterium]|nr:hypothetical protein [Thermoanaerobaculia bacterium]
IVIAAVCLFASWDPGEPFHAQPWQVPVFIALTPLFVRPAFTRTRARDASSLRFWWPKGLFAGAALIQLVHGFLIYMTELSWRDVAVILGVTVAMQAVAVLAFVLELRRTSSRVE